MKASDLELNELVDIAEGRLGFRGRRFVLHPVQAIANLRRDLLHMLGPGRARRVMTRFGYFGGQADAATMVRMFQWDDPLELLKAGFRMLALEGYARANIKAIEWDKESGRVNVEVVWHNSGEAEEYVMQLGQSDAPVCWKLAGYASGYISYCTGQSVYFVEKQCRGKGDTFCFAVGRDRESWGEELSDHLQYFEAEDIKGEVERLARALQRRTEELLEHRRQLRALRAQNGPFFNDVRSRSMQQVQDLAARVAQFDTSVLITGETGVGKEVLARFIHQSSLRADGAFVAVNCGALPESLLESELFGHKAGAFTGAVGSRIGLFEQGSGGTIFLDEIGDISPAMQLKILRVLQEKEIVRIGENKPRRIDIRVIAATNRDLQESVHKGSFREDLLYRLRVVEIEIPPLRQRKEDILPLARFLVGRIADRLKIPGLRIEPTCIDHLQAHHWPGNVRELENALERAAVFGTDGLILPHNLPPDTLRSPVAVAGEADRLALTLGEIENEHINAVMESTGGNQTRAAKVLGISTTTLWRRLKQMNH